jgi:Tol biopolymer transport system component
MVYEMTTGQRAFAGKTPAETLSAVMEKQPPAPSTLVPTLPHDLERTILRCLRKDPAKRFQAMADLRVDLAEIKEESDSSGASPAKFAPRRRRWVMMAAASAVLLVAVAAWYFWPHRSSEASRMRVVPLTTLTGWEYEPTFSPDGTQVAFRWGGEKDDNQDIYLKIIGSNEVRRVTTDPGYDGNPSWSPDGRQIAFLHGAAVGISARLMIHLVSPLGGPVLKLSDLPTFGPLTWSPDGRFIATEHLVSPNTRNKDEPGGIYIVPVQGGEPRLLVKDGSAPAFSPDGHRLAYGSCAFSFSCFVDVVDLDSTLTPIGPPRRLTGRRFGGVRIAWTRDGRSIVYAPWLYGLIAHLWRVAADGSSPAERIEEAGPFAIEPAAVASQDRLAFTHHLGDDDVYEFDGRQTRVVITSSFADLQPDFSHDGRRVVFMSERSGDAAEIWVANADGSNPYQLTHGPGEWQGSPRWSPDDHQIAFDSIGEDGWHIWAIDAAGGLPRQITKAPENQNVPTWSASGQWIYFGSGNEIWRVPATGGRKEQIARDTGGFCLESADGGSVLYQAISADGKAPLFIRGVSGGPVRRLVECVEPSAFGVRPSGIYYVPCVAGSDSPVHVIDPATSRDRAVGVLERGGANHGLAVSPDGKRFLFGRTVREGSDLMLIENFK